MPPILEAGIHSQNDPLDLVSTGPLRITGVPVDSANILLHLGLDGLQEEVVNGVKRIGEDELRPRKDAQFVADRIEVVSASKLLRGLVYASSPDPELYRNLD